MPRFRTALALTLAALATVPAAASAHARAQVLRDVTPLGGGYFKDRVFASSARTAHAAATAHFSSYPLKEGGSMQAAISSRYGDQLSTDVAQSYVDFLDSLDHGPELAQLKMYIAPPDEVTSQCGGQDGTLACYDSRAEIMVVPGEQTDTGEAGVTTSYVVAHEYGHHIANFRNNDPFNTFAVGPKYWASYEMVCDRASRGLQFPGDEQQNYRSNPGEEWAETYAHLKYPEVQWDFNALIAPDDAAYAAARRDVLDPWTGQVTKTFGGSFGARGPRTRRFSFDLNLDGTLQVHLVGPRRSNYNLVVLSNGRSEGRTHASGSHDRLDYKAACRQSETERVTVAVRRVTGSGPFTVRVDYAG